MGFKYLSLDIKDHVADLRIARPEKANAIDETCWREIGEAFTSLDANSDVRAIVLSGEGKGFTAGIDLSFIGSLAMEASGKPDGRKQDYVRDRIIGLQDAFTAAERCRKPVIAAIHGSCYGAGIDLITACDIRISTEDAMFCVKEIDL